MGKKLCKYCGIWARPTHEELHITTYGCMLCPGDSKTSPYQCSSLITARLHGLLKHQNENTYFKSATNDKPRRLSGGAPLLPGWKEGAERIPKPTVIVRRLHLDLREAVQKTVPTTQKAESKPTVKLAKSLATGEPEGISVDLAAEEQESISVDLEQEIISVDRDPVLWHPALDSPPDLDLTALENMDVADFDEHQLLPSEELPLPDLGSMEWMEILEM